MWLNNIHLLCFPMRVHIFCKLVCSLHFSNHFDSKHKLSRNLLSLCLTLKKVWKFGHFLSKNQFIKELAPKKSWWPLYTRFIWCISLHCKEEVPSFWCWQILKMPYWWVAFTDQAKTVGLYFIKARNMCKIFYLVPSNKPVTWENWDILSVYFSIFE